MTQKQLEDYLWGAANILRGMIDAADFKQYIFPLLFFKRVSDLWDEEYQTALEESGGDLTFAQFAENHRFQIPEECHWDDVRKRTVDVGTFLQKALNGIEKANFEMLHDVFGDAQWTNKRRMSDEKMLDLIEHFSKMKLTIAEVPHDIMGDGYEYLIKKFADDSGHTAAEFYTNRTLVKLMTLITDPKPGESVYDPTCGSGGILLNSVLYLKEQKKEYRTLKLYGQELNLITSAIARMNMFMHNIDEFLVVQGDTLDSPQILENDELKKFDVIMANPPYSIKRWSQAKWMNDPYGRNIWGTPPQGCADYAFQQHIMKSLNPKTGRCVVLWPHGVLFRDSEAEIRNKMIAGDFVDAVIGLGKNLFYNSGMESCLLICRMNKPQERKGKIIFIDAKDEIKLERSSAYLLPEHIKRISDGYWDFKDAEGFAKVVSNKDVLKENNGNLSVQLYIKQSNVSEESTLLELIEKTISNQKNVNSNANQLFQKIEKFDVKSKNVEKDKWIKSEIGAVSEEIKGKVLKPANHGCEKFIRPEDLEVGELYVKSFRSPKDVGSGKFCLSNDILFTRRSVSVSQFKRRSSIVKFDAVCSDEITVIRQDTEKLYPEFLNLILNTKKLWDYAIARSVGSVSKRINWSDLKKYEFQYPKERGKQEEITTLFQTLETTISELNKQKQTLEDLKQKLLNEILG
jgi:type I restriction enzyme M protein